MSKSFNIFLQSAIIFIILLIIGFWLAAKKPLWNDEAYSQYRSVQGVSYAQILMGGVPEGNVCPLFYVIQKVVTDVSGYALPDPWDGRVVTDVKAQWIYRVAPNACMALAMTLIFYFFARHYSWCWGVYALMLSLSSFMVWAYWVEARPYALWFLLTVLQLMALIKLLSKNNFRGWYGLLCLSHVLLSLTVFFSIIQITIIMFLWWLAGNRRRASYLFAFVLPLTVGLFYYARAPHYAFVLDQSLWGLITLNLSSDILYIAVAYVFFAGYGYFKKWQSPLEGPIFFLLLVLMGLAGVALIMVMSMGQPAGVQGFSITARYLVYLTPVGIIGAVVLLKQMRDAVRHDWFFSSMMAIVLTGLFIQRCLEAYMLTLGWYTF